MDVAIIVYDGVDELDAVGPYEVFATAADAGAGCDPTLVTVDEPATVTAAHDLRFEADATLAECDPGLLVVPGGGWNDRRAAGAWAEAERGAIPDAITRVHTDGATVAAVCTGAMLLARAGLLLDRPATTHHGARQDLDDAGATVVDARVVDDGDVLTCGGVTSGLDLALHLVEREYGERVAEQVGAEMAYERRGAVHRG